MKVVRVGRQMGQGWDTANKQGWSNKGSTQRARGTEVKSLNRKQHDNEAVVLCFLLLTLCSLQPAVQEEGKGELSYLTKLNKKEVMSAQQPAFAEQ